MAGVLLDAFKLKPAAAIAYLKAKGNEFSWNWYDTWGEAHAKAFTVAKAMRADVLQSIRDEVTSALENGRTLAQFQKDLTPRLKALGWWGIQQDETGKEVQLGSPWRLRTIYRANTQSAYGAGRYKQQQAVVARRPYWKYIAVMDSNTRPAHRALNGKVLRADDPAWDSIYPPNGYGCRCRVASLSEREMERDGLTAEPVDPSRLVTKEVVLGDKDNPRAVTVHGYRTTTGDGQPITMWPDPSWDHNPGKVAFGLDPGKYDADIAAKARIPARRTRAPKPPVAPEPDAPAGLLMQRPVTKAADVQPLLASYAAAHPEVMRSGMNKVVFDKASHFLATDCRGSVWISGKSRPELDGFNAKSDLVNALKKMGGGKALTFNQEYAVEGLWHEMLHNRAVGHRGAGSYGVHGVVMETLNQFIARHTYPEFMGQLGGKPAHHAAVLAKGYGYRHWVGNFRSLLRHLGITEMRALPVLKEISWKSSWAEQPTKLINALCELANDTSATFKRGVTKALDAIARHPDETAFEDLITTVLGVRRQEQRLP